MWFSKKKMFALTLICTSLLLSACGSSPKKIKVLILPKFEIGEMTGDMPGEAQLYYEEYLNGAEEYEIEGGHKDNKLYVKDDIAMLITGESKVNSALSLDAALRDERFDYSDAYIISTGCAGSGTETTVMGDVFVITATVDYDLGHQADIRDMQGYERGSAVSDESRKKSDGTSEEERADEAVEETQNEMTSGTTDQDSNDSATENYAKNSEVQTTWFHDETWDDVSYKILNQELTEKAFSLVKDTKLETTENTRKYMAKGFQNADWATRDPMVQKGTAATSDNYWKGAYDEANARLVAETYNCPDPYAVTEMEDNALAVVLDHMGMLDRFLIIRCSVDMDVFMNGSTPESLWGGQVVEDLSEEESADIFETAMHNNFKVGNQVIDAILEGQLS